MAKVTAPLLSFDAAGQIGKSQVYAKWKGRSYSRRYTVPANPNSADQSQTRGTFSFLVGVFKLAAAAVQAPWAAYAKGQPLTPVNGFIKKNLPVLRGPSGTPNVTLAGFIGSPGANGGLAPASLVLSDGGTHHAVATLVAPTLPAGWGITAAHAVALIDGEASTDTNFSSFYATDVSSPYAPSIATGAAGTYRVAAWFEFTKPDGSTAYGPSLNAAVTIA